MHDEISSAVAKTLRTAPLGALFAIGLLLGSCSHRREPAAEYPPQRKLAAPRAKVITAGHGCPGLRDISDTVVEGARQASARLAELGFELEPPLHDPTPDQLRQAVAEPRAVPILFLYSGHAVLIHGANDGPRVTACPDVGPRCLSAACLDDGAIVPFDDLVGAVDEQTPLALFVLDACTSADVDVRTARTNVAVISASPLPMTIGTSPDDGTVMTRGLLRLDLTAIDLDCDGEVTDLEVFRVLAARLEQGAMGQAIPKLRRQLWRPSPLLRTPVAPGCTVQAYDDGPATAALDGQSGFKLLGPVSSHAIDVEGKRYPAEMLAPMTCRAPIGQCFRLSTSEEP